MQPPRAPQRAWAYKRGEVIPAYGIFRSLMEEPANRNEVLVELVFAGLMDVRDRMLYNRSYSTGHKAYRARATVELDNALGWDNPHHVLYAGVVDMAVGLRWYSTYEMATNVIKMFVEGEAIHAVRYGGVSEAEVAMLRNTAPLHGEEEAGAPPAVSLRRRFVRQPHRLHQQLTGEMQPRPHVPTSARGLGAGMSA